MRGLFLLLFGTLLALPLQAQVPDIGDNSLFQCIAEKVPGAGGLCMGNIYQVLPNGLKYRGLRGALKRLNSRILRVRRLLVQSRRRGSANGLEIQALLNSYRLMRSELRSCWRFREWACSDGKAETSNIETLNACTIANDPGQSGDLLIAEPQVRIVNGSICRDANSSPVLQLRYFGSPLCTGSLVFPHIVITAAHCLARVECSAMSVHAENGEGSRVDRCISHPAWQGGTVHDVGILFLENELPSVRPVRIMQSDDISIGTRAVFAGYGRNEDGDEFLRATLNTISDIDSESIATEYHRGESGAGTTCNGDSGGPFLIFHEGEWKTVGTLSNGSADDCALPGTSPAVDRSYWANLSSSKNLNFLADHIPQALQ
ncbi:MAG: trypsin-like serine protease [Bdellovibrionales bacterium]|nr:trypsin-like serine protease [Bdellovibrionales bacterium]